MISKERLKEILVDQRKAILSRNMGVEREILEEIARKIRLPHVIVITGIRRCGKSTILRQIVKKFYGDEDFYYVNFEDERLMDFKAEEFNSLYECLIELFGNKKTFFLDEVQNIDKFESFVRRFSEDGFKFFITGSNAKLLSRELGTKLAGRHVDINAKPFSFREYLLLKEAKFEKNMVYSTQERVKLKKYFEDYFIKGGMPEYLIYDDLEILSRIYEDIVIKDILVRHNLSDVVSLKSVYKYLLNVYSNKFSYNFIKNETGLGSVNTAKNYIEYLRDTYFAIILNKFDYSTKKQIVNDKKIYLLDNGFIQLATSRGAKERGWALENLVCSILMDGRELFYYSGKNECDFIVQEGRKIISAFQVCYELNENSRKRETAGILEAMEKFHLREGFILTWDQEEELNINGKRILIKPVWKWVLEQ